MLLLEESPCVAVEGVFWISGEGGGGFLFQVAGEDVGAISLGARMFGFTGALTFWRVSLFFLLRVTCVHSLSVFPASGAVLVGLSSGFFGCCVVSVAFWRQTFARWLICLQFQQHSHLPSTTTCPRSIMCPGWPGNLPSRGTAEIYNLRVLSWQWFEVCFISSTRP